MVSDRTVWKASTASITANAFDGIMGDTTLAPVTVTLPLAPTVGQHISIKDAAGQFAVNNLTVNGNGNNIEGSPTLVLSTKNDSKILVWSGTEWKVEAGAGSAGTSSGTVLGSIITIEASVLDTNNYIDRKTDVRLSRTAFPALSNIITPAKNKSSTIPVHNSSIAVGSSTKGIGSSYATNGTILVSIGRSISANTKFAASKSLDGGRTWILTFVDIARTTSASPGTDGMSVVWDGSRFIAIHKLYNTTTLRYYSSVDGTAWTFHKETTGEVIATAFTGSLSLYSDGTNVMLFDRVDSNSGTDKISPDPIAGTWTNMTSMLPVGSDYQIFTHSGITYANAAGITPGSGTMFYQTTDNGLTWTKNVGVTTVTGLSPISSIASTSTGFYAICSNGKLITSSTMGGSWTLVSDLSLTYGAVTFGPIMSSGSNIWIITNGNTTSYQGNYLAIRTTDAGATFTEDATNIIVSSAAPIINSSSPIDWILSGGPSDPTSIYLESHNNSTEIYFYALPSVNLHNSPTSILSYNQLIRAMRVK